MANNSNTLCAYSYVDPDYLVLSLKLTLKHNILLYKLE